MVDYAVSKELVRIRMTLAVIAEALIEKILEPSDEKTNLLKELEHIQAGGMEHEPPRYR